MKKIGNKNRYAGAKEMRRLEKGWGSWKDIKRKHELRERNKPSKEMLDRLDQDIKKMEQRKKKKATPKKRMPKKK